MFSDTPSTPCSCYIKSQSKLLIPTNVVALSFGGEFMIGVFVYNIVLPLCGMGVVSFLKAVVIVGIIKKFAFMLGPPALYVYAETNINLACLCILNNIDRSLSRGSGRGFPFRTLLW